MKMDPIEKVYDQVAADYAREFVNEHDRKEMDRQILGRFAVEMKGRSPIWDFGCGPGQTTAYLWNLGLDIAGLDLSERMIQSARKSYPEIRFEKGNILDLSFATDSISGIVAFYAIVHFSSDQVIKAFEEVHRVLKPGGTFLLTFHIGENQLRVEEFLGHAVDVEFMFFQIKSITQWLDNAGFGSIGITERKPYPDIEYPSSRAYIFAQKRQ